MVLEGKTPAWEGTANEWRTRQAELREAGYRDHPTLRFQKEGEVKALVKDLPGGRWNHVQVVQEGNRYEVYAHTEPHAEKDPLTHLYCALTEEGVNFGAGASMARSRSGPMLPATLPQDCTGEQRLGKPTAQAVTTRGTRARRNRLAIGFSTKT